MEYYICKDCFNHSESFDLGEVNSKKGCCNFCDRDNVEVKDTVSWSEYFVSIFETYNFNDNISESSHHKVQPLYKNIQEDWKILNQNTQAGKQKLFFSNCLISSSINSDAVSQRKSNTTYEMTQVWVEFKESIISENRFFPSKQKDIEEIFLATTDFLETTLSTDKTLYRARTWSDGNKILEKEMKAPPKELSQSGRANSTGIPVLYVASDKKTAILESRPIFRTSLTLASLQPKKELTLLSLKKEINPNPFKLILDDAGETINLFDMLLKKLSACEIMSQISSELSQPLNPTDNHSLYAPTQYFCDYTKQREYETDKKIFDGIKFQSSVNPSGENYVIFDDKNVDVINTKNYIIDDMMGISFKEL